MAKTLAQTGSIGVARSATHLAEFNLLNNSEIVILALKPSLSYVLLISGWWLIALLPLTILACLSIQIGWFTPQARIVLAVCLAGMIVRLAFALLQWQSRVYVLTNLRVLRIRGLFRVEMFQCSLLQVKDVLLVVSSLERFLGLGTIAFSDQSSAQPAAHWQNIRHPQQVHQQIIEAINALKGQSSQKDSTGLGPQTILPATDTTVRTKICLSAQDPSRSTPAVP